MEARTRYLWRRNPTRSPWDYRVSHTTGQEKLIYLSWGQCTWGFWRASSLARVVLARFQPCTWRTWAAHEGKTRLKISFWKRHEKPVPNKVHWRQWSPIKRAFLRLQNHFARQSKQEPSRKKPLTQDGLIVEVKQKVRFLGIDCCLNGPFVHFFPPLTFRLIPCRRQGRQGSSSASKLSDQGKSTDR